MERPMTTEELFNKIQGILKRKANYLAFWIMEQQNTM